MTDFDSPNKPNNLLHRSKTFDERSIYKDTGNFQLLSKRSLSFKDRPPLIMKGITLDLSKSIKLLDHVQKVGMDKTVIVSHYLIAGSYL
jgi:hypothetical protein